MSNILQDSVKYRGEILHNCSILERSIDVAIGHYFCIDEGTRSDLYNFLLATNRITWDSKLDIFRLIVENNFRLKTENNYKKFKTDNPTYYNDIKIGIIEHRNIFAHQSLDSREGYIERYEKTKVLAFIDFKVSHSKESGDVKFNEYDKTKIGTILDLCKKYAIAIMDINPEQ